ncbi:Purine-uracil permease NCS1 [Lentibacillus sp. JNUCC-1]|uniref:NCS1 family transporter n=1 Tax=Lentibacillus sp. JNUCC-1 TaxID=2654513 RepID=UPI0013214D56|nr:NCS1 family transporter [Lentibacillus sp. JNUCC-1]MUV38277.1 Purine-uracil permease NCS1 [Lentibacillus sp. JNUCC-1]
MANLDATEIEKTAGVDGSLKANGPEDRTVGKIPYMFMWVGDGVNMGNMTLGASVVVAGVATLNIWQTIAAAVVAILIISGIFALNDRAGYKEGIPYVVQLRMSFGFKGTVISSLMRGVPAIIWYGIQSWIGGTALNEILKIFTDGAFDSVAICFVALQVVQIGLSLYGFTAIKWVESLASIVIMAAMVYVFIILMKDYRGDLYENWVLAEGSWGLPFFGYIMVFLGNYAAIFLNAADYSRELKTGISDTKRGLMYFSPIVMAYGAVLIIGTMVATVTGVTNPPSALAIVIDNPYVTVGVSAFIVMATIATNMVANIIPPTYVITMLTKARYKVAVTVTGLLAMGAFPWLLVQEDNSRGLDMFILIYSAFLGPIVAILLVEYYILRKQKVNLTDLYNTEGTYAGYNPAAMLALFIGAGAAFIKVDLAWIIGFIVAGITYILLSKYAFKGSKFKQGTIYEDKA